MGTNIWNFSAPRAESLSKADADRRNQLMLESPSRSDGDLLRLLSERRRKGIRRVLPPASRHCVSLRAPDEREDGNCRGSNAGRLHGGDEVGEALRQRARLGGGVSVWNRAEFRAAELWSGSGRTSRCWTIRPAITRAGQRRSRTCFGDLAQNERVETLRKAVLALPPAYREVVVLCDLHERDYAETASALGCAIGTVRSRLHRARALLAEKMRAGERCAV